MRPPIRILFFFIGCAMYMGCLSPHPSKTSATATLPMEYQLEIQPRTFAHTDTAQVQLRLHVRNTSTHTQDPALHQLALHLNGAASIAFMLRLSNGARPPEATALPAGATYTEDLSALVPTLFAAPGHYSCVLQWQQHPAATLEVEVQ